MKDWTISSLKGSQNTLIKCILLSPGRTGPPHKTPLQLAAAGAHLEVMEELALHASNLDWRTRDDWGWTLLHEVANIGAQPRIVKVETFWTINLHDSYICSVDVALPQSRFR